jgi:NAD(P)-dependent dehydrogenase (short-subunit alcohol dehydrogenase family)
MGVLDGKVVLVTGAGNGIGRECALIAAREGAKVVVNDLGGSVIGGAGAKGAAQTVADEIVAAGGEAVANFDSVADRKAVKQMVVQALDTFGGLHHVMNPAGIVRDVMFHEMSDEQWEQIVDVHLHGTYNVCRAAINHFRDQNEGNFVLFSSTSGLIGNMTQSNYAACKMGIAGLSKVLAMEGASKNVRCNAIAPYAWTRMFDQCLGDRPEIRKATEHLRARIRSDQVGTFCVGLCADKATTGQIFAVRGNEIFVMSQPRPIHAVADAGGWTPETVVSRALPSLKPSFYELQGTGSFLNWEPA